jgi:hypothetical protein
MMFAIAEQVLAVAVSIMADVEWGSGNEIRAG